MSNPPQTVSNALALPHTFDFEGQSVRYGVMGSGDPLVLVHGTPFSSQVWRRIAPIAARFRQVFFFDLLGYGLSEQKDGQDVSVGIQNRVMAALLDHWKLRKPDVIAHDFGGATALRAALLNQCEYRTLLLIDPVAVSPWGSPFVRHVKAHEAAFATVPAYIHQAMLHAYLQGAAHRALSPEALHLYSAPWIGEVGQAAFYRQIAQMDQRYTDEVERDYGKLRCPVSILWGREDQWIPIEQGERLSTLIPGARFTPVPGCGHLMQEDAPEAIVAEMMDLMRLGVTGE